MSETATDVFCEHCDRSYDQSMLADGDKCPDCGEQLLSYPGLSRGSAAERLADLRAQADTEEKEDKYRMLLHLLACNLLTKGDIFQCLGPGILNEHVQHVLGEAIENAEQTDGGEILVCPSCGAQIKSWARWYTTDTDN